jgi:hypothetical protein
MKPKRLFVDYGSVGKVKEITKIYTIAGRRCMCRRFIKEKLL